MATTSPSLTRRNLVHVRREPAQLSDATVQPVLFTVLFVYIFGAAMVIPGGGTYKDFAIGGLVTMNLTTASMGTAVGLSSDLSHRRDRPLPHAADGAQLDPRRPHALRPARQHPVRHDRADHRARHRLAARQRHRSACSPASAVAVLFAYALSWFTACIGLPVERPRVGAGASACSILFPLAFVSSCFVPTQGLPGWLRPIADWNPVSAVAASCRDLFGNPNPASLSRLRRRSTRCSARSCRAS